MRRAEDEARRWLRQAKIDLGWADHLTQEGGYHIACFLAQQVAEKALKAFLYACGEELVIGHSVAKLSERCCRYDPSFEEKKDWRLLDSFYVPTRYPNGIPDGVPAEVYNKKSAQEAVELAKDVVSFVEDRLLFRGVRVE